MFKYKKCHGRLSFVSSLILKIYHKKYIMPIWGRKGNFCIGSEVAECGLFHHLIPQIIEEKKQCRQEIKLKEVSS